MRISLNTFKWYDSLWAALIFFTRLPFWRIYQPPRDSFKSVVEFWPLVGWLTGGIMAAVIYFGSMVMPLHFTVICAILVRILITGALHEDGLADFIDGFGGGGRDRSKILSIMKDSRIGTYGVLGLVAYFLLIYATLSSMPPSLAAMSVLAADPFCKMVSGQTIMMMPYARTEDEAKARVVYRKISVGRGILMFVQGVIPVGLLLMLAPDIDWTWLVFAPCITMYVLYLLIWKRIKGYTGDCCGAIFLMTELSFYFCILFQYYNNLIIWKSF